MTGHQTNPLPTAEFGLKPLCVTIPEAAQLVSVGRSINDGTIEVIKLGMFTPTNDHQRGSA